MSRDESDPAERALERWVTSPDPRDDRWRAAVEDGLRASSTVRQRHRRLLGARWNDVAWLAAAAVVVLAVGASLFAWRQSLGPARVGSAPPPAAAVDPFVVLRRPVPSLEPVAVAEHAGALWVANLAGDLYRIDPRSGEAIRRQPLARGADRNVCGPLSPLADFVWVPLCASGPGIAPGPTEWAQVEADDGRVVRVVRFGEATGTQLTGLGDQVWAISAVANGALQQVDPASGELGRELVFDTRLTHVVGGFGSLWASAPDEEAVLRIDPEAGSVTQRIHVDGRPGASAVVGDRLLVALEDEPSLVAIDPDGGRVEVIVPLSERAIQISATDEAVWVLTRADLLRIDLDRAAVVRRITVGEHSVSFAPQFTGPTFALGAGAELWFVPPRGDMLRLLVP